MRWNRLRYAIPLSRKSEPSDRARTRCSIDRSPPRHLRVRIRSQTAVVGRASASAPPRASDDGLGVHTVAPCGSSSTRQSLPTTLCRRLRPRRDDPDVETRFVAATLVRRCRPRLARRIRWSRAGHSEATADKRSHLDYAPWQRKALSMARTSTVSWASTLHDVCLRTGHRLLGHRSFRRSLLRTIDGAHWSSVSRRGSRSHCHNRLRRRSDAWLGDHRVDRLVSTADGGDTWRAMASPGGVEFSETLPLREPQLRVGRDRSGCLPQRRRRRDLDPAVHDAVRRRTRAGVPRPTRRVRGLRSRFTSPLGVSSGSDDGAHLCPLTEDTATGPSPVTPHPASPESQSRRATGDGRGRHARVHKRLQLLRLGRELGRRRIADGSVHRPKVRRPAQFEIVDADSAVDSSHVFAEVRRLDPNSRNRWVPSRSTRAPTPGHLADAVVQWIAEVSTVCACGGRVSSTVRRNG